MQYHVQFKDGTSTRISSEHEPMIDEGIALFEGALVSMDSVAYIKRVGK